MKTSINLYLTTRDDPVADLDDIKDIKGLETWREKIKNHALKIEKYGEVSDKIISALESNKILECYAIITYPPENKESPTKNKEAADDEVGEKLLDLLKSNSERLNWQLEETGLSAIPVSEYKKTHPYLNTSKLWDNFTYSLIMDKTLAADEFEVYLEAVVKRP